MYVIYDLELLCIAKEKTYNFVYKHTYLRFIPKASRILRQDTHVLPKPLSYEEYCRRNWWQAHRRLIRDEIPTNK
jgi:hypothetical protein